MRRLIALFMALGLVVAFAGCSSDSTTSTEDAAPQSDSDADAPDADSPEDAADALDDLSDDLPPGMGNLGECLELSSAYLSISMGSMAVMGGPDAVEEMQQAWGDLEGSVPDELQGDFQVLSDAFDEFAAAFEGVDTSDPTAMLTEEFSQQMEEASAALETPEAEEAQANIEAWLDENCGEDDMGIAGDLGN